MTIQNDVTGVGWEERSPKVKKEGLLLFKIANSIVFPETDGKGGLKTGYFSGVVSFACLVFNKSYYAIN